VKAHWHSCFKVLNCEGEVVLIAQCGKGPVASKPYLAKALFIPGPVVVRGGLSCYKGRCGEDIVIQCCRSTNFIAKLSCSSIARFMSCALPTAQWL
jgi:hypothetical protein